VETVWKTVFDCGQQEMNKRKIRSQGNKSKSERLKDLQFRKLEILSALALTGALIFLHIHRATRAGPLWRDEVGTLSMATFPSLAKTWSLLATESFPVLFYTVVRIWMVPGWHNVDLSLRALGAIIGIAGLLALWSARHLIGNQAPILALALFGANATVVAWGDSLRAYGLASALILVVYGLVWKVAVSPTTANVIMAACAAILSVQCLYQNSFLVFAICIGGCLVCIRRRIWRGVLSILGIGAVSAVSLLPYVPVIIKSQPAARTIQFPFDFAHLFDIFSTAASSNSSVLLWGWLIAAGVSVTVCSVFIFSRLKANSPGLDTDLAIFSVTVLILGTVLFMVFLKAIHLTTEPWYFIAVLSTIALSTDIAVGLLTTTTWTRILRLSAVIVFAIIAVPIAWEGTSQRQTNIDLIALQLAQQASPRDFVVIIPWFCGVTFQNYYRGETKWYTAPPIPDSKLTRYDLLREEMMQDQPMKPVFDEVEKSLKAGGRVWVVGELAAPAEGQLPPSLPPAPNGPNGWYSGDYLGVWNLQLGYFVKQHSITSERVIVQTDQPVNPYENSPLLAFTGWQS
jgi:hypothetical protein